MLIFTFSIRTLFEILFPNLVANTFKFLNSYVSISHIDYLWTSLFSFLIAVFFTLLGNLFIKLFMGFIRPISYAVRKHGDEIEKLFRTSARTGELMQITLKNNKVYIGFTDIIPVPKETNYLKITPVLSGYRESESKILKITTEYFEVLDMFTSENSEFEIWDIDISIKQDEILTANIYDQRVFDMFNQNNNSVDIKTKEEPIQKSQNEDKLEQSETPIFR